MGSNRTRTGDTIFLGDKKDPVLRVSVEVRMIMSWEGCFQGTVRHYCLHVIIIYIAQKERRLPLFHNS